MIPNDLLHLIRAKRSCPQIICLLMFCLIFLIHEVCARRLFTCALLIFLLLITWVLCQIQRCCLGSLISLVAMRVAIYNLLVTPLASGIWCQFPLLWCFQMCFGSLSLSDYSFTIWTCQDAKPQQLHRTIQHFKGTVCWGLESWETQDAAEQFSSDLREWCPVHPGGVPEIVGPLLEFCYLFTGVDPHFGPLLEHYRLRRGFSSTDNLAVIDHLQSRPGSRMGLLMLLKLYG